MKRIRIEHWNPPGGLIVAYSDDLKGLLVHGRSVDEIKAKLPGAIKEILDAQGVE